MISDNPFSPIALHDCEQRGAWRGLWSFQLDSGEGRESSPAAPGAARKALFKTKMDLPPIWVRCTPEGPTGRGVGGVLFLLRFSRIQPQKSRKIGTWVPSR